jgi:hypothetical protein
MGRIRDHLTYANVMVTLLAFIVLTGGTAVALGGSNTVQSDDLGPGAQVKKPDIAADAVGTNKVINDSLTGTDIDESSLGEVPSATLGGLGSHSGQSISCNPEDTTFSTCGMAHIDIPAPSRVLIIGQIRAEPDTGNGNGGGSCKVSGRPSPAPVFVNGGQTDVIAVSGVTDVLEPAQYEFDLVCNETASGIRYFDGQLSVVALSPN